MEAVIVAEDLVGKVVNESSRVYFSEAVACHKAGAYRAAVVMMACAVFEDLRSRMKAYAPYDDVAKVTSDIIETAFSEQSSYEAESFRRLKRSGMLDNNQKKYLFTLMTSRNMAAHASGVLTDEVESARHLLQGFNLILSKGLMWQEQGLDQLIERMNDSDMFPKSAVDQFDWMAAAELAPLNPDVHGQLIDRIAARIEGSTARFLRNASIMLTCLARQQEPRVRSLLYDKLFRARTLDYSNVWLVDLLAADPQILTMNKVGTPAVDATLAGLVSNVGDDRVETLEELFDGIMAFSDRSPLDHYPRLLQLIAKKLCLRPSFIRGLEKGVGALFESVLFVETLEASAADKWAGAVLRSWENDHERFLAEALTSAAAFRLVQNICQAADISAPRCAAVVKFGFQAMPSLREKALAYMESEPEQATDFLVDEGGDGLSLDEFVDRYLSRALWVDEDEAPHGSDEPRTVARRVMAGNARRFGRPPAAG